MARPKPKTKLKIRKPRRGSKANAILTLTTTTPATPTEIAESVDTSVSNVSHTLARYGIEPNTVESFKKHRAEIIAGMGEKILRNINIDTIKIETAKEMQSALTGWGILYDKERLERGESTSNVSIHADIAALKTVDNSGRKPVDNLLSEEIP